MKKLILTGLVVTIGFAPAFALAQTGTSGRGTGTTDTTQPSSQPGSTMPGSGTTTTPSPSPDTGRSGTYGSSGSTRPRTPDTPSTIANKGECERAGGKWHDTDAKCGL